LIRPLWEAWELWGTFDGTTFGRKTQKQSYPCTGHWIFTRLRLPEVLDDRHMKMLRLSALWTGHINPQEKSLVLISVRGLVDPRAIVRPEEFSEW